MSAERAPDAHTVNLVMSALVKGQGWLPLFVRYEAALAAMAVLAKWEAGDPPPAPPPPPPNEGDVVGGRPWGNTR